MPLRTPYGERDPLRDHSPRRRSVQGSDGRADHQAGRRVKRLVGINECGEILAGLFARV